VRNVVPNHVNCIYVRQPKALGLGHAVLCAKPAIGDEPFAVVLPDDIVESEQSGCLKQMTEACAQIGGSVIGVEKVPMEEVSSYGVVSVDNEERHLSKIHHIVEKPPVDEAPSNLAVIGRYILQPEIFNILENTSSGAGGEIQLTDAIEELAQQQSVHAFQFDGIRYDCGSKMGFLKATVQYALKHPELGEDFADYLKTL